MSDTPRLGLPLLAAAQAQKHTTHNDALMALDAIVHLSVVDRDLGVPPAAPAEDARYIVGSAAVGEWAGRAGEVAVRLDGGWRFFAPRRGWTAHVEDEGRTVTWSGTAWASGDAVVSNLGVNASPDAANRIVASLAAALFTDEGAGIQFKLNKTAPAGTASYLFQTGFSGRAEFGLTGGEDFQVKVSPDGSAWRTALSVARATADVTFGGDVTATTFIGTSLQFGGDGNGRMELGRVDQAGTPYMDFHSSGSPNDYDVRLLIWGGTPGVVGEGNLNVFARTVTLNGKVGIGTGADTVNSLRVAGPVRLAAYTVATVPSAVAHGAGAIIHVSNGAASKRLAISDGTAWRWPDGAVVS